MSVRIARRGAVAASRVTAPAAVNVLTLPATNGNYATTPDSPANSITNLDMRVRLSMSDWTPSGNMILLDKWDSGATQKSFEWFITPSGTMTFGVSTNGANETFGASTAANTFTNGTTNWVRVTRTSSGGSTAFYVSSDATNDPDSVIWDPLGTSVTITSGGPFNGTATLALGATTGGGFAPLGGNIYYAEIRSAINGTVVAKFDPSTVTILGTRNPTTLVASTGETWTMNGSAWDWATI